jgi:hypothetical protein
MDRSAGNWRKGPSFMAGGDRWFGFAPVDAQGDWGYLADTGNRNDRKARMVHELMHLLGRSHDDVGSLDAWANDERGCTGLSFSTVDHLS